MVKMASNAFLATQHQFINEIANVCEVTGADVEARRHGVGSRPPARAASSSAGIGYGAACFPKEPRRSSSSPQLGLPLPAAHGGHRGERAPEARVVGKLVKHLGSLRGTTIALLGLAFKPMTNDMRERTSLVLAPR
jgi:UDPglucose 6-dehydrogenase